MHGTATHMAYLVGKEWLHQTVKVRGFPLG